MPDNVNEADFTQFLDTIRRFTNEKLKPAELEIDDTGEILEVMHNALQLLEV